MRWWRPAGPRWDLRPSVRCEPAHGWRKRRPAPTAYVRELSIGQAVVPRAVCRRPPAVERKRARIVLAAGEGIEGNDPTNVLLRRIVKAFAAYERRTFVELIYKLRKERYSLREIAAELTARALRECVRVSSSLKSSVCHCSYSSSACKPREEHCLVSSTA